MDYRQLAGQQFDDYQVIEQIGAGGMSAVYWAHQPELNRDVAVKVLSSQLSSQAGYIERFQNEAKMAASLEHPHIVPIYDFGTFEEMNYVVMRLLTGGTLEKRVMSGDTIHRADAIAMVEAMARALDYAHGRGIIHRDVKLSNIMFDEQGSPYLVDFGIAKATESNLNLTSENVVLGTPAYMPPEQWEGDTLLPQTDQYALAVVMFRALTRQAPFEASTPPQIMYKHVNETPPNAHEINRDLSPAVSQVLNRALAKRPQDRYPLVSNFANALRDTLMQPASPAQPLSSSEPTFVNQKPVLSAEATLVSERANEPEPAAPTYENPSLSSRDSIPNPNPEPEPVREQAAPPPNRQPNQKFDDPGNRTMMMQVAAGSALGVGLLIALGVIIVIGIFIALQPDSSGRAAIEPTAAPINNAGSGVVAEADPTQDVVPSITPIFGSATGGGADDESAITLGATLTPLPFQGVDAASLAGSIFHSIAPQTVQDVMYGANGTLIAAANGDGTINLWVNGNRRTLVGHSDVATAVEFSPDGAFLLSSGGGADRTARLWEVATGQTVQFFTGHTDSIRDIAYSPTGELVATAAEDSSIRLWNPQTGTLVQTWLEGSRLLGVDFNHDGTRLVSGGRDTFVNIWNVETGTRDILRGHSEEIRDVVFSPDGTLVASSSNDNTARIWNVETGQTVHTLTHPRDVFSLRFNPDSTLLVSGGRDNNVRLWDVTTGQQLNTLTGHAGWVLGVDFSADGSTIISGSGDGAIRTWETD